MSVDDVAVKKNKSTYLIFQIYIRSTNVNRTIISAMSLLYGLFPPGAWNIQGVDYPNNVNWQQGLTFVPIHVDDPSICVSFGERRREADSIFLCVSYSLTSATKPS